MKRLLSFAAIIMVTVACNNAADTKVPEDPTFEQVKVDTLPADIDTSAMKSDTSKVDKAIRK